mmetsp:Transcript_22414/g.35572  ORF Transcript_22414/g.35572 Transcript_22414/m.35572 type:complete len:383 (-) Transcript_22414:563-1711(-)
MAPHLHAMSPKRNGLNSQRAWRLLAQRQNDCRTDNSSLSPTGSGSFWDVFSTLYSCSTMLWRRASHMTCGDVEQISACVTLRGSVSNNQSCHPKSNDASDTLKSWRYVETSGRHFALHPFLGSYLLPHPGSLHRRMCNMSNSKYTLKRWCIASSACSAVPCAPQRLNRSSKDAGGYCKDPEGSFVDELGSWQRSCSRAQITSMAKRRCCKTLLVKTQVMFRNAGSCTSDLLAGRHASTRSLNLPNPPSSRPTRFPRRFCADCAMLPRSMTHSLLMTSTKNLTCSTLECSCLMARFVTATVDSFCASRVASASAMSRSMHPSSTHCSIWSTIPCSSIAFDASALSLRGGLAWRTHSIAASTRCLTPSALPCIQFKIKRAFCRT